MSDTLATIASTLRDARTIAVASHVRPDGDSIGSIVALGRSMALAGKTVHIISEDAVPGNLTFLPGTELIQRCDGKPLAVDVAVALDTATKPRLGELVNLAMGNAPVLINIDHHGTNPNYGHLNFIDTTYPATGEIVYELLSHHGFPIDEGIRQNLFAAISTDTGSFQYDNTSPRTHRIVADMMEAGLDTAELARQLYQSHPLRRTLLLKALLNEMKITCDGRIASWALTLETQHAVNMEPGDTEGLIDSLRTIEGVIAAVIFEDMPGGKVRISARSKDPRLDVSKVCAEFGGGGHRMASGARMSGPINEAETRFLDSLQNEIKRLG
ncbi:MAG TPA: bifunctional oligoribonuclease/PAP phosphatase NrnA [Candidatus Saccharimonadia bacterium]|nr:bifunctional oligoribonuclease/PAP phosphatase NrnA [Candidatus Saccharimonadia bacterium]